MRKAFLSELVSLSRADERVNLIVGDLGFGVVEPFAEAFPERFLNAGVSEQSMTGMAAGLALAGDAVVFTYSIGTFPTLRCLEQIRNDICYHNANVKIVSVGGGVAYGAQGHTHHVIEDLAVMRAMPGMVVAAPADPEEAKAVTKLATDTPGPWYIRLGQSGEPTFHEDNLGRLKVGKAVEIFGGTDGTVFATGAVAAEAHEAVRALREQGREIRLLSVPFVRPLDVAAVRSAARETPWMITVEEHHGFGGLGSAVAEVLTECTPTHLKRLHYPDILEEIGSQDYLRDRYGLNAAGIGDAINRLCK